MRIFTRSAIFTTAVKMLVVWFWIDSGGAYSFTDDPARVPAAYREEAQRVESGSIWDYPKTTISEDCDPCSDSSSDSSPAPTSRRSGRL